MCIHAHPPPLLPPHRPPRPWCQRLHCAWTCAECQQQIIINPQGRPPLCEGGMEPQQSLNSWPSSHTEHLLWAPRGARWVIASHEATEREGERGQRERWRWWKGKARAGGLLLVQRVGWGGWATQNKEGEVGGGALWRDTFLLALFGCALLTNQKGGEKKTLNEKEWKVQRLKSLLLCLLGYLSSSYQHPLGQECIQMNSSVC